MVAQCPRCFTYSNVEVRWRVTDAACHRGIYCTERGAWIKWVRQEEPWISLAPPRPEEVDARTDGPAGQGIEDRGPRTKTPNERAAMTTYQDDIEIGVGTSYEAIDPGVYRAVIEAIEPDESRNFSTGAPKSALKFTFRITDPGDFEGQTIDRRFITPSLHEKATLGIWYRALIGPPPETGNVKIKATLIGKACQLVIKENQTDRGVFARVADVLALPQRRQRPAAAPPPPVAVVDDEDDDFEDA